MIICVAIIVLMTSYAIVPCGCHIFDSSALLYSLANDSSHLLQSAYKMFMTEQTDWPEIKRHLDFMSAWLIFDDFLEEDRRIYVYQIIDHPVNAFHLIRDWVQVKVLAGKQSQRYEAFNRSASKMGIALPTAVDFDGALLALVRLQKTYGISVSEMIAGLIDGVPALRQLDIMDCYRMGRKLAESDQGMAVDWFEAVLGVGINDEVVEKAIHKYLLEVYEKAGATAQALYVATLLDEKEPGIEEIENKRTELHDKLVAEMIKGSYVMTQKYNRTNTDMMFDSYRALCRGENIKNSIFVKKELICIYRKGRLPYVVYKEEIHSFSPRISIFHEVINDKAAQKLIEISLERLASAKVGKPSDAQVTTVRVSKVAWLEDDKNRELTAQISDMTGLATDFVPYRTNAEYLQVGNYGLGGHYYPHYDFYAKQSFLDELPSFMRNAGDRLATFMLYLTDVKAGGATVFPNIGVYIAPVKNGAAFWYNFDLAGEEGDKRTLHGACPVLYGQKWVANKWIRQHGQMFRKPCALHKDADYPVF